MAWTAKEGFKSGERSASFFVILSRESRRQGKQEGDEAKQLSPSFPRTASLRPQARVLLRAILEDIGEEIGNSRAVLLLNKLLSLVHFCLLNLYFSSSVANKQ